ncbi:hypothetical protein [Prosthecobacter dejongeii]|uniref:Uncharacterized protein n=1 Tax=Prosthecobacter dejongeii TaxID=48465 RepID=A0A7W7YMS7_9BACT|nr:hypothetical protein [Prosthecobacter dejongeii]MBB5039101.1 hypothetical protein [Prosthecobacter dejongeii]
MAAQASDSPTASATSQELALFPEDAEQTLAMDAGPVAFANEAKSPEMLQTSEISKESEVPVRALPPLPQELKNVAKTLEKVLHDPGQLQGAFASFCAAAYVKPEWAGAASEYLTTLFEHQEDTLAEMTRVPDLIIELGSGHYTLTFMVASRWAAKADLARLTRLAEALIATQSKMNSTEVVDLMLALTTSLSISRYSRAEQLLSAASAHAGEDEEDALREAHLWLGAGGIVRGCTQEARDLWDVRLRRPRVAWTWTSAEECSALAQLAHSLDPHSEAAVLFQAVVPSCWWDLLIGRARDVTAYEAALTAAKAAAQERARQVDEIVPEPPKTLVRQPIIVWRGVPFFIGGLVGAWALVLGIWAGPYDLVRTATEPPALAEKNGVSEVPQAQSPVLPEHPHAAWRKAQTESLAAEVPELRHWVEKIELGEWKEFETLLKGDSAELPKDDPKYQKLLLWLHLDPPSNAQTRRQVPLLLASLRQDSTVIELWEKLVYPGSLNAQEIQEAALRTQHESKEAWSPTQRAQLSRLVEAKVTAP